MASVAPLTLFIRGNAAGAVSALAQAKSAAAGFRDTVFSIKGAVAAAATALGVGLSANALKNFISGAMESIDATAKLSDRLGIATEALVGLQHAANLAGVSNDQLTLGIEKMLRALPSGATAEDAFKAFADELRALPTHSERARLAFETFGKSGQKLIPLLLDGAEGIKAAQREAERLGITFNRIDAAKVEAANDAMTRLHAIFTGIGQTLAIQVAPYIEALTTHLVKLGSEANFGPKIIAGVEMVVVGIAKATDYVNLLSAAFYGVRAAVLQVTADVAIELAKWAKMLGPKASRAIGLPTERELRQSARGFAEAAAAEAAKVNDAMAAFHRGDNANAARAFFDDIKKRAQEAAQARVDAIGKLTESGGPSVLAGIGEKMGSLLAGGFALSLPKIVAQAKRSDTNVFAAATERRHSFSTPGAGKVNDAQLREAQKQTKQGDKTNALLDLIKQNLAKGDTVGVLSL